MNIKEAICVTFGMVGSVIARAFGGWDSGLTTITILMCVDFIGGLAVAAFFHNSKKTTTGTLESRAGWKGLCRKGMTLLIILIGYRLDLLIGTDYIRNALIIGFSANELISIVENAGLMGIPMPDVIKRTIDVLVEKGDEADES